MLIYLTKPFVFSFQVQDYQKLINSFNEDTEVYLIQSNEDGFKKIDSVLKDNCDVSSLHIIGHGSAGKILFGNATLSNDTIQSYNQTLSYELVCYWR